MSFLNNFSLEGKIALVQAHLMVSDLLSHLLMQRQAQPSYSTISNRSWLTRD